jgi:hypothetical protein
MARNQNYGRDSVRKYMSKMIQKAYDAGWGDATEEAYGSRLDDPLYHYEQELRRVERILEQALDCFESGDMVGLERILRDNVESREIVVSPDQAKRHWVKSDSK